MYGVHDSHFTFKDCAGRTSYETREPVKPQEAMLVWR